MTLFFIKNSEEETLIFVPYQFRVGVNEHKISWFIVNGTSVSKMCKRERIKELQKKFSALQEFKVIMIFSNNAIFAVQRMIKTFTRSVIDTTRKLNVAL